MNYHGRKVDAERVKGWLQYFLHFLQGPRLFKKIDVWRDKQTCGVSLDNGQIEWEGYKQGKGYLNYGATRYLTLRDAFKGVEIKPTDKLLDMGCGKGRIFAFIIRDKLMPLENVYGIDVNPGMIEYIRNWPKKYPGLNVEVADGFTYDYSPFDIITLFNPISPKFFIKFLEQLEMTATKPLRLIFVVDDFCGKFLTGRSGWTMTKREVIYKKYGLKIWGCGIRHFSHWTYVPNK